MNRRTFMKGAVVAASTPAAALAPIAIVGLASIIAQFSEVKALYTKAVERIDYLADLPSNPGYPAITEADLPPAMMSFGGRKEMHCRSAIDFFFDQREAGVENSRSVMGNRWADQHLVEYRKSRSEVIELYEGREARRDLWEIQSGYKDADVEAERLSGLMNDLDDRILYGPCETMDDVRLKVAHIKREYGDNLAKAASFRVLESLAA